MMQETIRSRIKAAQVAFGELVKQREQKTEEINNIDTSMAQYQGEYRALTALLSEQESLAVKSTGEAATIDVDKALKGKKNAK